MRLLRDNKGQIRIIEAFFASLLILSTIALIPSQPSAIDSSNGALQTKGQDALTTLDRNGYLSTLIENENWAALRKCLISSLSPAIWFNLTVFDENMNTVNNIPISTGSPISEKIVSIEYVCAGIGRCYTVYLVRLQLSSVT
jgi:hypothetical protein